MRRRCPGCSSGDRRVIRAELSWAARGRWRRGRRWPQAGVGYVLLLRDSRGVLASTARTGKDLRDPIKKHVKWTRRLARFARQRGDAVLTVRYEDLCSSPAEELARIAAFLDLEFDEAMLRHAENEHHFVHSSRSPRLWV